MSLLPWHEPARRAVLDMISADRVPHALLVRGTQGWGEVEFAAWLALTLLGLDAGGASPDQLRGLAHPDLRWIAPDGAVIKVEDVRALNEFAVGTRQSAPRKVAVIQQADLLNLSAANALLKTLEEPPPATHLVLTTSQPGRLLPTIVSRCQSIVLRSDEALARAWLGDRWDPATIDARLFEYGFAPLALDAALGEEEQPLLPMLDALARARSPGREVETLLGMNPERLLGRWYRCCVALAAGRVGSGLGHVNATAIAEFVDELVSVRRQVLYSNSANARLLLERLAARWRRAVTGRAA